MVRRIRRVRRVWARVMTWRRAIRRRAIIRRGGRPNRSYNDFDGIGRKDTADCAQYEERVTSILLLHAWLACVRNARLPPPQNLSPNEKGPFPTKGGKNSGIQGKKEEDKGGNERRSCISSYHFTGNVRLVIPSLAWIRE